jgi:hypothetical protein
MSQFRQKKHVSRHGMKSNSKIDWNTWYDYRHSVESDSKKNRKAWHDYWINLQVSHAQMCWASGMVRDLTPRWISTARSNCWINFQAAVRPSNSACYTSRCNARTYFAILKRQNFCPQKDFVQLFRFYFHNCFCFNRCSARFYLHTGAVPVAWFNPFPFTCVFPVYAVHVSLFTYKNLSRVLVSAAKLYQNGGVLVWVRKRTRRTLGPRSQSAWTCP